MKWTKDPRAESGLKRLGIEWEVGRVALANINRELSMERQARIGKKLNDDWVVEYATAMQNGAEFPMPILQVFGSGKKAAHFIWSGNHRVGAADLIGETEVDAYLVKVNDLRLMDILPRVVNTWEGNRESRDAVLEHARHIIEKHNLAVPDVARMFGLKEEWLSITLRASAVAKAVEDAGVKANGFPKTTLIALSPLTGNKNVLKATCKLLHDFEIAGDRMRQVLNDVKLADTEGRQLTEVNRWRKLLEEREEKPATPAKVKPFHRGTRTRLVDLLTQLEKLLLGITQATQLQLDDADIALVTASWAKIAGKMSFLMREGVAK